jgi:uncharacterized protein (TIGR02145 family)
MLEQELISNVETLAVGSVEWTTCNLNVVNYRNGDSIPEVRDPLDWANSSSGAWCHYNNDPQNDLVYGKLYNIHAVNDPRGLAPVGFHIPTEIEWSNINTSLRCKEHLETKKEDCNSTCSNFANRRDLAKKCGFTFLGGYRFADGQFSFLENAGFWWCKSEEAGIIAWVKNLGCSFSNSYKNTGLKAYGYSVRCIKD